MKRKKIVAGLLAVMMVGQVAGSVTATAAETANSAESSIFNDEGLWLTEIYQNDVDRSTQKDGYIANNSKLSIANILYAGVLISSLGAVMDVSVSVVAALYEIHEKAPKLSSTELFKSGMHVGHDMMGTMSNTLILAYTGSATATLLTIYSYEMPYLQIMGYNSIIIEIVCGFCGTIGVILTVPLQAFITTAVLKSKFFKKFMNKS